MKHLLDTNVYLDAFRSEDKRSRFRHTFFPLFPATFLSAVVAYEVLADAADRRTRADVREFIFPFERARPPAQTYRGAHGEWPADKAAVIALLPAPPRFQCAGNDFEYDPAGGTVRLGVDDPARCQ